jgi:bifunctional non-homologous end joining protein LigD
MLAREVPTLPHGEDWMYEYWWGGERVRAVKCGSAAQLVSRDGRDLTNRFPRVTAAIARIRADNAVIDGEVVYLDAFPAAVADVLRRAIDEPANTPAVLLAYDLLWDDGRDIRQLSLLCRRLLLSAVVQGSPIALAPWLEAPDEPALHALAEQGFRGVVAKRAGSAYRPNALASDWVKVTFPTRNVGGDRWRGTLLANLGPN